MSAIYILVGASITIAIGFLIAFIWSVKNGQYEDDYTPSVRMLFDETAVSEKKEILPAKKNFPVAKEIKQKKHSLHSPKN
jgi:cbb3-type cytochrome oxidase maturation protein